MKDIKYIVSDITSPIIEDSRGVLICHCVNDQRLMGSGVAKALYQKWPVIREQYIKFCSCVLGDVQYVDCEPMVVVANMVGQHMIIVDEHGNPPVRYDAVRKGLQDVALYVANKRKTFVTVDVHIPYKMCCDRAGGKWEIIEEIIKEELCSQDIAVIVYDIDNLRGQFEDLIT